MNYNTLGKEQERRIVRWCRDHGFPKADRVVRTGAGRDYAHRPDEGDVWLAPGVIAQSKRMSPVGRAERAVPQWMRETEAQGLAAHADVALLIVRREGTTDVGEWWAFLHLGTLIDLVDGRGIWGSESVRMTVADAATLIRVAGYGEPLRGAA